MSRLPKLAENDLDRVVEMAWEDRTTFDAIAQQFGLAEKEVITIMRRELKPTSFKRWRKRVQGRITKHEETKPTGLRFKAQRQRLISGNCISKSR